MSVTSTTNRKSYAGDAVTASFATNPVVFFDTSDLAVSVVSALGVETALTENTHYAVTGGDGTTGTVNLAGGSAPYGAPASGVTLLILRVVPLTQPVDLVNNDGSDAEVQERAYDRLTMMVQQLNEVDSRAIKLPASEVGSAALTELPVDRASKFLAFDSSKNPIASAGPAGSTPVSAFMETVLDDATAADARTTLGAAGSGAVTGSGLTMSTARVLGRTTAGVGAVEELTEAAARTAIDAMQDVFTTRGDLVRGGASGVPERVGLGTVGQVLRSDGTDAVWGSSGVLAAVQASTSGTAISFTGIPSWVTKIELSLNGVSTDAASALLVQIGDSGGIENSGYVGSAGAVINGSSSGVANYTSGFGISSGTSAGSLWSGTGTLTLIDAATNAWAWVGVFGRSDAATTGVAGGAKALTGTLTQLQLVQNGAGNFDAGQVNIRYS